MKKPPGATWFKVLNKKFENMFQGIVNVVPHQIIFSVVTEVDSTNPSDSGFGVYYF